MTGVICGTGAYVPAGTLDNHEISQRVDTSSEWIEERTGVLRRHIIQEETTATMAARAGRRALADAGMNAEELEMILVSTASPNLVTPSMACVVQQILGAGNAVCFDMNAACSGFLFAYNTAQAYIAAGICRNILVIGSESLSNLVNWDDRGTCILFGDGAGAVVLRAAEGKGYKAAAHSDGTMTGVLTCSSRHTKDWEQRPEEEFYLQMDGRSIFQFAARRVPEVIDEVLAANDMQKSDIDYFILHQANKRIVEAAARRMKEAIRKFPMNMQEYGNTSSASIPLLLDELRRNGTLKPGQKLVMAGFGAGLSWGAAVLDWNI